MLTPEYLESCSDSLLGLYDALNETIVRDIARRIVKTGRVTESAAWQAKQVQEAGRLLDEVIHEVAGIAGYSDEAVRSLFYEAGVASMKYEGDICSAAGLKPIDLKQSPAMMQTLTAAVEKTKGIINNLTMTTASMAQDLYYRATNLAYMQVASGAFPYQEAIKQAVKSAAAGGGEVLYKKGHSSKLDVAVRRSVLTGVNQTAGKLTEMYADEVACDYYEVSAHAGARNTGSGYYNHEYWQGQVYCISGRDRHYRQFNDATGYGEGGGLCGWNCRHSFHLFFPGLSVPAYSRDALKGYADRVHRYRAPDGTARVMDEYTCTQAQRAYERKIRESKRLLAGYDSGIKSATDGKTEKALKEAFTAESIKLKKTEAEMKDFCRQTGMDVDSARTQVYAIKDANGKIVGFDRSVSQKAVWADRKAKTGKGA